MSNQWPDFSTMTKPKTIRRIVIEEGDGIVEKTNGEIRFIVESQRGNSGGFIHQCFLDVAKASYRYPMMRVVQTSFDYPVTIIADNWPQGADARNEGELREKLGLVFTSDTTKNVVLQLLDLVS